MKLNFDDSIDIADLEEWLVSQKERKRLRHAKGRAEREKLAAAALAGNVTNVEVKH